MIVSENNIHDALAYLSADPHPLALARKDFTDAETNAKTIFARLLLSSKQSSVATKEAEATQDPAYLKAKEAESSALMEVERHKARMKAAEMLIEVFRTENANARAAERIR